MAMVCMIRSIVVLVVLVIVADIYFVEIDHKEQVKTNGWGNK